IGSEPRELLARGGPVYVRAHEQHRAAAFRQMPCELGGGCRLAGALQTHEHDHSWLAARREWTRSAAENSHELVMHDLDERLPGIEAARDFLAQRAVAYAIDKCFRH